MQDGNGGILPVGGNVDGDLFGDEPDDGDGTSDEVPSDTVDSCQPLFECFDECASDDQNCVQTCIDNGGLAGERFLAWGTCRDGAGCVLEDGSLDTVCAYESCAAEMKLAMLSTYLKGPNPVRSTLLATVPARQEMMSVLRHVWFRRAPKGTLSLVKLFGAVRRLDASMLRMPSFEFCIEQNCASEVEACFGPVVQPLGDDDCFSLSACMERCAVDDRFCIGDCVEASSPEGLLIGKLLKHVCHLRQIIPETSARISRALRQRVSKRWRCAIPMVVYRGKTRKSRKETSFVALCWTV